MSSRKSTAQVPYFHPRDPAGWLKPGEPFVVDGLDWSWAFVVYRPIQGHPDYCIGSNGTAWSKRLTGSWVRSVTASSTKGYRNVSLCAGRTRKTRPVHRAVLEAFIGPRPEGMVCCHYDDNLLNNRISNLRWDTPKSNSEDAARNGLYLRGGDNPYSALVESQVIEIREAFASGGVLQRTLADRYGVDQVTISLIVRGETWAHAGGPITRIERRRTNLDADMIRRVRQLVATGMTQGEVGQRLGICRDSVSRITKRSSPAL